MIALFKRKKEEHDEQQTVDFRRPLPYWQCSPIEYEDYMPLMELKPYLDDILERLFEKDVDSGNANVLDGTINAYAEEALKDLERQRQDHIGAIHNKVVQRAGTETRFRASLVDAKAELDAKSIEVELLKEQYLNGKKNRRTGNERYQ